MEEVSNLLPEEQKANQINISATNFNKKHFISKTVLIILVIIFFVFILTLGLFFVKNKFLNTSNVNNVIKTQTISTPKPSPTLTKIKAQSNQWNDYVFSVKEFTGNDPKRLQLISENIKNGEKKVLYDTDQFKEISDKYFNSQGNGYNFFLPFRVVKNTLFFSVKTEGYNGDSPGPGTGYYLSLPITNSTPIRFSDKPGEVIHSNNHYWYNDYITPSAESAAGRTFNLLDINTKTVIPIMDQGSGSIFIGITSQDKALVYEYSYSKTPPYKKVNQVLRSISLFSPYSAEILISSTEMPDETTDISLMPSKDKLLIAGTKGLYFYEINNKAMTKIVNYNEWNGDKFILIKIFGNDITIAHVDNEQVYLDSGTFSGATPACGIYTFSTNNLKLISDKDTLGNLKCEENTKPYSDLLPEDNITP